MAYPYVHKYLSVGAGLDPPPSPRSRWTFILKVHSLKSLKNAFNDDRRPKHQQPRILRLQICLTNRVSDKPCVGRIVCRTNRVSDERCVAGPCLGRKREGLTVVAPAVQRG